MLEATERSDKRRLIIKTMRVVELIVSWRPTFLRKGGVPARETKIIYPGRGGGAPTSNKCVLLAVGPNHSSRARPRSRGGRGGGGGPAGGERGTRAAFRFQIYEIQSIKGYTIVCTVRAPLVWRVAARDALPTYTRLIGFTLPSPAAHASDTRQCAVWPAIHPSAVTQRADACGSRPVSFPAPKLGVPPPSRSPAGPDTSSSVLVWPSCSRAGAAPSCLTLAHASP